MPAALFAILLLFILSIFYHLPVDLFFSIAALVGGTLILFLAPLIRVLSLSSLQSSTIESTSWALSLVKKDRLLQLFNWVWGTFIVFSYLASVMQLNQPYWMALWLVWFAVSIDCCLLYLSHIQKYIDPFSLLERFLQLARSKEDVRLAIDAVAEIGLKAELQKSMGLALTSIETLEKIGASFLPHQESAEEVNFHLYTLFQRLDLLYNQAVESNVDVVAQKICLVTVKLLLPAARAFPENTRIHFNFLEKFYLLAQEKKMEDVVNACPIQLLEMSKTLLKEPELQKKGVGLVLMGSISLLEKISKDSFQRDKNIPIEFFTHPFRELKNVLTNLPSSFNDRAALLNEVERVLAEFEALQAVLEAVPNIPGYQKKSTKAEASTPA